MKLLLMVVSGFIMTSCAQNQLLLSGQDMPYSTASSVTPVVIGTKVINIVEVKDNREKTEVGEARTGVQYRKTPIILKENVENYISDYFKTALNKRNISTGESGDITLKIIINQLWLSEVLNNNEAAKCEANFSFFAFEKDRTWKGNIWTEYQSKGDLSDGTDKLGPTLATCLNSAVEKLVTDQTFISFIKR